jgi:hypothetical protein
MRLPCSSFYLSTLALLLVFSTMTYGSDVGRDPVVLSFSTVGDSRQDPKNFDPATASPATGKLTGQDAHWLQNSPALARILRGVSDQHVQLLFFNGDMIMGYGRAGVPTGWSVTPPTVDQVAHSDLVKDIAQYAFWRGMVAPLMETGTYVLPVPGNHELQCNDVNQTDSYNQLPCAVGKHAVAENEIAWSDSMGDLILDGGRFKVLFGEEPSNVANAGSGADGEATDQSKLSYSFDFRGSHFAVINTDRVGTTKDGGSLDSHAPVNWLSADLEAAKRRGMRHMFVFGHKMAFTYDYTGEGDFKAKGLDEDIPARDQFWALIERYHATYFCGHEHVYDVRRPRGGAYQVLVGSGGSPFEVPAGAASAHPATDRTYAWATVRVHRSGLVELSTWGFNDNFGPTHRIKVVALPRH